MTGPRIPNSDHLARLCAPGRCDGGRPRGAAFLPKPSEPLSTNWLEITAREQRSEQLAAVRQHLLAKELRLPATGLLAVIHLEASASAIREAFGRDLFATHEPIDPQDPSHAEMHGFNHEDDAVADLLAMTVIESHPAREPER